MVRKFFGRQYPRHTSGTPQRKKHRARRRNNVGRNVDLGLEQLEPRCMLAAGDLDPTFGIAGLVVDDLGLAKDEEINATAVQGDGKIVVAGLVNIPSSGFRDFLIARYNPDGTRDTSFGTNGFTTFDMGGGDFANDIAIDSLGRIVVVGSASTGGFTGFGVVRLTASGQLDTTFDGDGKLITILQNSSAQNINSAANAVALQADGKIVVGGTTNTPAAASHRDFAVARYNANGSLDTTFDVDGYVFTDFDGASNSLADDNLLDITVQSDGGIVAVGSADTNDNKPLGSRDFAIARYNANGSLDTTFSGDGKVMTDIAPAFSISTDTANSVVLEPDGQIVVGGFATIGNSSNIDFILARYNSDGTLDPTFAPSSAVPGTLRVNMGTSNDLGKGLFVQPQPDGKYVIGGDIGASFATTVFGVARVLPNGQLDTTFSGDGMVTTDFPNTDGHRLNDLVMGADGKIVAVGWVQTTAGNHDIALARYESGLLIAEAGGPYAINEPGGSVTLNGSGTGSGLTFEWDFDGSDFSTIEAVGPNPVPVFNVSDADGPTSYTVWLRVTDSTGFQAFDSATINVVNVAPALTVDSGSVTIDEGQTAAKNGTYGDVPADSVALTASVGTVTDNGNGTWSWSFDTTDGPVESQIVTITASDEDGGSTDVTFDLTVNNVAPTANAGGPYFTFDDTPITLNGSGFDVAGAADPLTFEWDLDDNGTFETTGANPVFDPQALGFTGTQTRTVTLRVSDGDGGQAVATTTVELLGVGSVVIGGVLHIVGSDANDIVVITRVNDNIKVIASFNQSNPTLFSESSVTEIQVRVRGGHDIVVTTPNVTKLMTIDGGSGNDLLTGGGGRNVILGGSGHDILHGDGGDDVLLGGTGNDDLFGGSGNDVLVGGDGNDILNGGTGRDLIIGSQDEDLLVGGNDEDILIGGYTSHDGNVAALDAIMAIWGSAASFNSRIATLTGSGGLLQAGVAVFDDDDCDIILGGAGRDLVFGDTNPWDGALDLMALQPFQDVLVAVN